MICGDATNRRMSPGRRHPKTEEAIEIEHKATGLITFPFPGLTSSFPHAGFSETEVSTATRGAALTSRVRSYFLAGNADEGV